MEHIPAWIQGVAAAVQAAVAVFLWRVTTKYVRLTHHLSQTAENQLALLGETELHRRRADLIDLASLARRLLKSLEELPGSNADGDASGRLLFASLWRPEELGDLRVLAAKGGADFAEKAEQPAVDLNWMLERIHPVRTEERGNGVVPLGRILHPAPARQSRACPDFRYSLQDGDDHDHRRHAVILTVPLNITLRKPRMAKQEPES